VIFDKLVVDIDGTIANNAHRAHLQKEIDQFLRGSSADHPDASKRLRELWNKFYELTVNDIPVPGALLGVKKLLDHPDEFEEGMEYTDLIYCTGREDLSRKATISWLKRHGFPTDTNDDWLLMRPTDDTRPTSVVKEHLLSCIPRGCSVLAIDDEDRTLLNFHTLGYATLKAPYCWDRLGKILT
jgi:hypothetical protein